MQSITDFILFCIRFVFMNNTKNMSKGIKFFDIYIYIHTHVKLGSVNELCPTCKNYFFIILSIVLISHQENSSCCLIIKLSTTSLFPQQRYGSIQSMKISNYNQVSEFLWHLACSNISLHVTKICERYEIWMQDLKKNYVCDSIFFSPSPVIMNLITHWHVLQPEIRREYCQQNSLEMLTSKALCTFRL
jgi:hypothetical protein